MMPAGTGQSFSFDPSVLDQLACPACRGALRLEKARLCCEECDRTYPIVDGIPTLIARLEKPLNE
jgi:uncharacterized protein YbaR (Trm112 family)